MVALRTTNTPPEAWQRAKLLRAIPTCNREWHKDRKRYSTGWSQSKRAKPTHADPEDDRRVDPALPSGSTSWTEDDLSNQGPAASASQGTPSMRWRPRLHARRDASSNAGDTSEGSATGPRLGSIGEVSLLDEEALRTLQERVNQSQASRGDSR